MTKRKFVAALTLLVLVLVACGQKPGVHVAGRTGNDPGSFDPTDPNNPGGNPDPNNPGNPTDPNNPGGNPTDPNNPGGNPTDPNNPGPSGPTGPADRTGIDVGGAKEIRIGVHAPLSGAAPISPQAFRAGADTYWKNRKVHGRTIKVYVEDDNYTPSVAQSRCNDMVVRDKVFVLIGAAGTDQILTCGKYANARKIPYFSAGVQETGVKDLAYYFALTMSYAQQMPLLSQYIRSLGAGEDKYSVQGVEAPDGVIKIAFIRPNTPNFNDAQAAFEKAVKALSPPAGKRYETIIKVVNKEGSPADATAVANDTKSKGVDILVPITAPSFTAVNLAAQTGNQQYFPRYVGVGISNGVNQGIAQACRQRQWDGAMFFSPFPGWSDRAKFDKNFDSDTAADDAARYNTRGNGGDILLAIYGIMKTLHGILDAAGPDLSRGSLVQMMRSYSGGSGGFFPNLRFAPGNPFGALSVHALLGKCDPGAEQFVEHPQFFGLRDKF